MQTICSALKGRLVQMAAAHGRAVLVKGRRQGAGRTSPRGSTVPPSRERGRRSEKGSTICRRCCTCTNGQAAVKART